MTSMMIREPAIRHTPLVTYVFSHATDPRRAAVEGARATGKASVSFWRGPAPRRVMFRSRGRPIGDYLHTC